MKSSLALLAALLVAVPAGATEWHIYGARAMAMGGAATALARGPIGSYWNPAGLGTMGNTVGFEIPVGGSYELSGPVIEGANDLNQVAKECQASGGVPTSGCSQANIDSALEKINRPGNGLRADLGFGFMTKIKRAAFFFNNMTYVGARPFASVSASNTPGTVVNNQTKLTLRGINVSELGVGYGRELPFAPGLFAGGNLKMLVGRAGYNEFAVVSNDIGDGGGLSRFEDSYRQSTQPGVDAGLLWDIDKSWDKAAWRPRLGLVGRNLNSPRFKNPEVATRAGEGARFPLHGQVRAGAAISPLRWWNFAADVDLTRNTTPVDGVLSQQLGLGTEINVFNREWINIPLRAGLSRNIADDSKTAFSLGGGLSLIHMTFDVAIHFSPESQTIQNVGESREVPNSFGFMAQLGFTFGGAPEKSSPKVSTEGGGSGR